MYRGLPAALSAAWPLERSPPRAGFFASIFSMPSDQFI